MKFFKGNENRLKYEFLPAAEEIIETPPSPFGRIVLWLITLLVVIAFIWSYLGKLDIIASATGKIAPQGSIKTIQPAISGVVTDIAVVEGQEVNKGDVLIKLDDTIAREDLKSAEQALTVTRLERDILAKTLTGKNVVDTVNAANIPEGVKQHLIALAESRAAAGAMQQQLLTSGVTRAQQQVEMQRQNKQEVINGIARHRVREQELIEELDRANVFTETNLRNELRSTQQQIASLESSLAAHDQQITQVQAGVNEANEQLNAYSTENKASVYTDIVAGEKRITELENVVAKAQQTLAQTSIKAPVDGTVLTLAPKTVGGVVNAAQSLVEIVPKDTQLIVEASVQNKDIGFIQVGQSVVVKVDTYSFQRYGYLKGKVTNISPDAINDEKQGLIYKMKVKINQSKTSKDQVINVEPGMSVTAEITTGQRRIIEFFLDPLITYTDRSLEVR